MTILPVAYSSLNKSYNTPSRPQRTHDPVEQRKGPLMIVGSGGGGGVGGVGVAQGMKFIGKASKSKLAQHRESIEESRLSSSKAAANVAA